MLTSLGFRRVPSRAQGRAASIDTVQYVAAGWVRAVSGGSMITTRRGRL